MSSRGIVNLDTGVIIDELHEGDRVVRAKSIEYYKEVCNRPHRTFSKVDIKEGALLIQELTSNERSMLFLLQYYVAYESCLIRKNNGDMTFNDIVELSGWSRSTTNKTLDALIEKNILYKGKNGRNVQYFLNPWVVHKGTYNKTLVEMFKNYKIRSMGGITWGELVKVNG